MSSGMLQLPALQMGTLPSSSGSGRQRTFENTCSYLTVNKLFHPKRLECSFCLSFIIEHDLTDKGPGDVDIHPGHPSMNKTHFELGNMKACMVVKLTCTHCDRS